MKTLFIGHNRIYLEEVDSTNDYLLSLLGKRPPEGTSVITYNQTKGRGQRGNSWFSEPQKNITLSLLLYPNSLETNRLFDLHRIFSLALIQTIKTLTPLTPKIKWPNDILIGTKKIAGILIENFIEHNFIQTCVAGIGLNVNQEIFPETLRYSSTSLLIEGGETLPLIKVEEELYSSIEKYYLIWKGSKRSMLEFEYLQNLYRYQEPALYINGENMFEAELTGIRNDGAAALKIGNKLEYFNFKEIIFV